MSAAPLPLPQQALADGFAHHVARWAREAGASQEALPMLQHAARAASLATAQGDVCCDLADVAAAATIEPAALRRALLASPMVGTPERPGARPLILDGEGRLYLHRYFDYEARLARRLTVAAHAPAAGLGAAAQSLLAQLFAANARRLGERPDWQKIATALALQRRLAIVSGGPGTGKTTTVVNVLACALAEDPECRIRLTAPTGKAAARMLEAVRRAAASLPEALRARMPVESFTVHRLLGVLPWSGEFRHHAGNPLPLDLLVVDEASMLDLALATRLMEAVPPAARIILLGDKDQLAAVESGAVFSELSADPTLSAGCVARLSAATAIPAASLVPAPPAKPSPLRDSVVWLTENFRFAPDSGIGRLSACVNAGEPAAAMQLLRRAADAALEWIEDSEAGLQAASLRRIVAGYSGYVEAARAGAADPAALFEALGRFRVLCAERDGARGVEGINRQVSQAFRKALDHPLDPGPRSEWYPGRPVMVLRNDYVLKLFNGDVGIVAPDASNALVVYFPDGAGFRPVPPARLPEHGTAFAMTVHKAQGSEFEHVLLMLPAQASRVLTRELVYTGLTRARSHATIVAGAAELETAIASPTRRYSGLLARLRQVDVRAGSASGG